MTSTLVDVLPGLLPAEAGGSATSAGRTLRFGSGAGFRDHGAMGPHRFYTVERTARHLVRARCECGWATPEVHSAGLAGSIWDRHEEAAETRRSTA